MTRDPQADAPAQPGDEAACRAAVAALLRLRYCLSYNDSYCGEPAGDVKRAVVNWMRLGATPFPAPEPDAAAQPERDAARRENLADPGLSPVLKGYRPFAPAARTPAPGTSSRDALEAVAAALAQATAPGLSWPQHYSEHGQQHLRAMAHGVLSLARTICTLEAFDSAVAVEWPRISPAPYDDGHVLCGRFADQLRKNMEAHLDDGGQ